MYDNGLQILLMGKAASFDGGCIATDWESVCCHLGDGLIGLILVLDLLKLLVGFDDLLLEHSLVVSILLGEVGVAEREDGDSEDSCIFSGIDSYCGDGYARGHLDDGEHSVESIKHTLDGDADDRQGGMGSDDTGQCGRHAGAGEYDLDAASLGFAGEGCDFVWSTVGGERVDLKGDIHRVEQLSSLLHDREVAGAAHDDAYERFHIFLLMWVCGYRL